MNLLQLEYFRELAYTEHVQETAQKLHVSASTISVTLRKLEEELDVFLFDRVGRNVILNDCGRIFLPYVEQIFDDLEQGVTALKLTYQQFQSQVSFSVRDAAFWSHILQRSIRIYHSVIYTDPGFAGRSAKGRFPYAHSPRCGCLSAAPQQNATF
jgi:DNA-binding transcriptional LysR family regulator